MTQSILDRVVRNGKRARKASTTLAYQTTDAKRKAIKLMADKIELNVREIIKANENDLERAKKRSLATSFLDRMTLTDQRVNSMIRSLHEIAALPDPVGVVLASFTRPNGLLIEKKSTPIGVIAVIYESRPNVTADAAALCLLAGNSVILRGGSDAFETNQSIFSSVRSGLESSKIPLDAVQFVDTIDRSAVGSLLTGLDGNIDVIVPRGGKSLVARIQDEARVPVFAHLEGICHTYIHKDAEPKMAQEIVFNAKMRRTGICGATETLLVDEVFDSAELMRLIQVLQNGGCRIRGEKQIVELNHDVELANEQDWETEYLEPILSLKLVSGLEAAINHIQKYGSNHTEAIITNNQNVADEFLQKVDSAIVMHNASTQFADGGEFGMGAEIGISTGKMHARGPVGVEQLTTFKYLVRGTGQIRPLG